MYSRFFYVCVSFFPPGSGYGSRNPIKSVSGSTALPVPTVISVLQTDYKINICIVFINLLLTFILNYCKCEPVGQVDGHTVRVDNLGVDQRAPFRAVQQRTLQPRGRWTPLSEEHKSCNISNNYHVACDRIEKKLFLAIVFLIVPILICTISLLTSVWNLTFWSGRIRVSGSYIFL